MSRIALITGGGRGLGRAFAVCLARHGWTVAVASRSVEELEATLALVRAAGSDGIAVRADVADQNEVHRMVAVTEDALGPIDLLINNAGSGPPYGPTWEIDPLQWWGNLEVNLKGPLLCCRAVLPGMVHRRSGRIVNVASGAGTMCIPYMSAYVTGKTALIRMTEVLAAELKPHDVAMFAMEPGTVRTAMAETVLQSEEGRRWLPWFQEIFDQHRDVSTEPAEKLVLYLASGEADALSGRFFVAPGAPEEVIGQSDRILKDGLRVLRMRF